MSIETARNMLLQIFQSHYNRGDSMSNQNRPVTDLSNIFTTSWYTYENKNHNFFSVNSHVLLNDSNSNIRSSSLFGCHAPLLGLIIKICHIC